MNFLIKKDSIKTKFEVEFKKIKHFEKEKTFHAGGYKMMTNMIMNIIRILIIVFIIYAVFKGLKSLIKIGIIIFVISILLGFLGY